MSGGGLQMAVIGIGNMGSAHAAALFRGEVPRAVLSAVCDTAAERREWAAQHLPGVPVFETPEELFASDAAEAVIVATPHYLHPPLAIAAFARGWHVLTEKPGGVRLCDVRAMAKAARTSGRVFGVMFNQRTHPLFQQVRQIVRGGELGVPKRLQWTVTNWYRPQAYYDSGAWRASWAGEGGGVLLNQAPHQLDLWQWIFGMPQSVRAYCACGKYHRIEVEDDATVFAEYASGATATFITSTGEYPGTNRLEIVGDRGKLVLEEDLLRFYRLPQAERVFCFGDGTLPPVLCEEIRSSGRESGHVGILDNFTEAVLDGKPLLAPGEDAVHELTLSNAAYLSAWTGETVSLPMDTDRFDRLLAERTARSAYRPGGAAAEADGRYKERWNVTW